MLFLRIPDTLSRLDLLTAVYLASTYPTYRTYVRIRRNCLDGKIIIPYMRANRTTRYEAKKYSDQTTVTLNDTVMMSVLYTDIITAGLTSETY